MRQKGVGWIPPNTPEVSKRKDSPDRGEDQSLLMSPVRLNLIVKSIMMTVVHMLRSSSLAYSLHIHCTGLTSPKYHSFWAWPEKRGPTIIYIDKVREINGYNK